MANPLTPFSFGQSTIRTTTIGDTPWFSAADVCAALGIKNHRDSLLHLDEDEKGVVSSDTLGGQQKISVVNESGLYALVLRSRKPEARKFAKWVTGEVLPAIRKMGGYQVEKPPFSLKNRRFHVWIDENGNEVVQPLSDAHYALTADGIACAIKGGEMPAGDIHTIATAANIGMMRTSLALKRDGKYAEVTKQTKQLSTFELGELASFAYGELLDRATKNKKGGV